MHLSTHEKSWLQGYGTKMLTNLGVKPHDTVIDFGCGEGRYTIPLAQVVGEDGKVYAIETDERAIQILQERASHFTNKNTIEPLQIDRLEASAAIPEHSVNCIFAFDVLQYIEDWESLFHYFSRVLKANGKLMVYPAVIPHPGQVEIEALYTELERAGFRAVKSDIYKMMHNVDMVEDKVYSYCLK